MPGAPNGAATPGASAHVPRAADSGLVKTMIILTAAQSRELDRLSQQKYGIDSYVLMTNAGEAVARVIARRWPEATARGVLVIAGKGNNGGDGLVAARRLHQTGERVR